MSYPVLGDDTPEAFDFGRLAPSPGMTANKLRYDGERHILLVGTNGSGKGTRILLPNLLNMRGSRSLLVTDPKGELAAVSAPFRRTVGRVVILNPFRVLYDRMGFEDMESTGFNPLLALNPAARDFPVYASLLAEAMVTVGDGVNAHFDESARALVSAIIMYVVCKAHEVRRTPTMAEVRQLLCLPSEAPREKSPLFPQGSEGKGIPLLAREMMKSSIPALRHKASQFCDWNREIQSIVSTAKRQTECFDDPEIADDLAKPGFDFRELKRTPTTVYLILPPEMMDRHRKWLRLAVSAALQASMRPREKGEPRILLMLDEFASLSQMQIIENVWSVVRGYGIQLMPVVQDLNQLSSLYKERWQTFVGNAGALAFFAPNDPFTAEWVAKRLGDRTIIMNSVSEAGGKYTASAQPIKVPVMTAHDLYGLEPGHLCLFMAGLSNGTRIYAPPYYRVTQREKRARVNPYFTPVPRRRELPAPAQDGKVPVAPDALDFLLGLLGRRRKIR